MGGGGGGTGTGDVRQRRDWEDEYRVKMENAALNLNILRKMALHRLFSE
jgi:hypothetical protein